MSNLVVQWYEDKKNVDEIENVFLHIIQPRTSEGSSSWNISTADLIAWGESIKPIAELADKGEGEFKCGDWCRFCKAKANCRARTESFFALEEASKTPKELLTDAEIGEALTKAQALFRPCMCKLLPVQLKW